MITCKSCGKEIKPRSLKGNPRRRFILIEDDENVNLCVKCNRTFYHYIKKLLGEE